MPCERLATIRGCRTFPSYAWVRHCGWEWFHLRRVDSTAASEASAYLHVDDVDSWFRAMSDASAGTIAIGAPIDTRWGMREFDVRDPWGNLLRIGSNLSSGPVRNRAGESIARAARRAALWALGHGTQRRRGR